MKSKIIFITLALAVFFTVVFACSHSVKKTEKHSEETSSSSPSSLVELKVEKPVNQSGAMVSASANIITAPVTSPATSSASVNPNKIAFADYYFGFNTQMIHGPHWSNNKFINAVKNLHPENLRYPGGTIANYWDWKKGWFIDTPELQKQFRKVKPNPITLENFKLGIDATHAMPVYVLNILTSDIKYQLEMLHHAKDLGLEVKLIELGNEFYLPGEDVIAKFPTGKDYALECNKWIVAIKKEFPSARIAVVGRGRPDMMSANYTEAKPDYSKERAEDWDKTMFANLSGADAVTFHIYPGPGVSTGKKKENTKKRNDAEVQRAVKSVFDNNVEPTLGMPFVKLKQITEYSNTKVPKGMKTWYTEYNMYEKNLVVSGTWTHGLFVSLMTVLFLNINQTELICNHNLTTNARMAAIFNDENGFENHLEATKTTPLTYSAGGMCLSLAGQAINGKTTAQQLDFTNTLTLKTIKEVTYPSLVGYKFTGNAKESALIFNLDASAVSVDLSKVASGDLQFKTYSGDPLKQIVDDNQITTNTGKLNGALNLPAYSITLLY